MTRKKYSLKIKKKSQARGTLTHLQLIFLYLNEGLACIFVDCCEKQKQLLHSILCVHVVGDEACVEQPLYQQPVLNAGHVVAV